MNQKQYKYPFVHVFAIDQLIDQEGIKTPMRPLKAEGIILNALYKKNISNSTDF